MKNNKGFSLVELIIVIAIMAILVGIMAPQLIKYIEKANITADEELLDAIYDAVVYASVDPDVLSDPASDALIASMSSPMKLEDIMTPPTPSRFCEEVLSTLGWDDVNQSTYEALLHSSHAADCEIYFVYNGDFDNPVIMWITTTDISGKKCQDYGSGASALDPANPSDMEEIEKCIHIQ